ncbi:glycerophosphodiester phosphodiesterase [Cohnella candidum]|nr:glycerophosphodiester phosphodiesterase family protein [Cohnella candidum]
MPLTEVERMKQHPCVAHRGFSGKAPENTMAAFRMALAMPEVQWMELDVHLSRDQIPVVIHDATLKRTTNAQGRVSHYTAAQLAALDAGSWFNPSYSKEGVPTLDQVLALSAGRCRLNVEIKAEDAHPPLAARRVLDAIMVRKMEHDVVITSFNPAILIAVRELTNIVPTGLIINDQPPGLIANVRSLGCTFLSIGFRHLTLPLLQQAEQAGVTVMAWTVDQAADLKKLVNRPEPIMICTNFPDRWLQAIRN